MSAVDIIEQIKRLPQIERREIFAFVREMEEQESLEDLAMLKAIRDGEKSPLVSRTTVFVGTGM